MTIYSGFTHWKWWLSIVMLVYQRVTINPRFSQNGCFKWNSCDIVELQRLLSGSTFRVVSQSIPSYKPSPGAAEGFTSQGRKKEVLTCSKVPHLCAKIATWAFLRWKMDTKSSPTANFFLGAPNIDSNRPILNGFMLGIAHNWVQPHMG